ncbi:MAG: TetR/AcrR family transcriptional regulator, partial [Pseudomonadota bacterium]
TASAVAEVVDRVDRRRLAYLETLMAGGRDTRRARAAFVYWAYVGRVMSGVRSTSPDEAEIAKIAALFDRDEAPRSG